MDPSKAPRGRARGRARSAAEQPQAAPGGGGAHRPAGAWGSGNPMRGGPHGQPAAFPSGLGPQPGAAQPRAPEWGPRAAVRPPAAAAAATAAPPKRAAAPLAQQQQPINPPFVHQGQGDGNADAAASHGGRGAHRGRRPLPENIKTTRLVAVGKQGTTGKPIVLQSNYFRLEKRADWCIYQYRVDFAPEIDVTFTKKKLFYTAVASMNLVKGLFDGTILFTPYRITPEPKELVVDSLANSDEKIRITIRMVGELNRSSYQYLQVYNLIMRKCMSHLRLQPIKRDYFDPANKIMVNSLNLELWPGLITSIRQHESDVLMCVEVKHKLMKLETAYDIMKKVMNDRYTSANWKNNFKERMLNTIVLTDYNNKTYHVDDVEFGKSPSSSFQLSDNSMITFAAYYSKRYGINIRNMDQPLLVTQVKPKQLRGEGGGDASKMEMQTMLLIPELCRMTGLTEEERTNRQIKEQLEPYMMPTPRQRIDNARRFHARLTGTPGSLQELSNYDLKLSSDIITLNARNYEPQRILCGQGVYSATHEADWTKFMRSKPMYRSAPLDSWAIIYAAMDEPAVQSFYGHLIKAAAGMAWKIATPKKISMENSGRFGYDKTGYSRSLDQLCTANPNLKLVFALVPNNKVEFYSCIKKKLTVEKGIPSQVVTTKTCKHKSAFSIATKVAVQMNVKVGGAPWSVEIPLPNVMICGYDVCHDSASKGKSWGAFVASYDKNATLYYSAAHQHKDGEELSNFIGITMVKAVVHYKKAQGKYPDKILFYRDGVGDGQLTYVIDCELLKIREVLEPVYAAEGKPLAPLRMIIVNKRINTRFFANGDNPPPGTVVDDVVTMPDRTDFFLIPQCTRKGTVTPTYYNVLGPDEFGLSMDYTQILTFRLCHQYYNWSGTVRVPAPCQYAHKLAFLAAQALQRPPPETLSHLLHFL